MPAGIDGYLGVVKQNSFGTAITSAHAYFPIYSEGLVHNIEVITEANVRNQFGEANFREGLTKIEGDFSCDVNPHAIGHILRGITGQSSPSFTGSLATHDFLPRQADFDEIFSNLPPYMVEVNRGGSSLLSWQLTDTIFNKLSIAIEPNNMVKATVGAVATTVSLMTANAPTFATGNPYTWDQASISLAATAVNYIENLTIDFEQPTEPVAVVNNTKRIGRYKRNGAFMVRFSGTADFQNQSAYSEFVNQTEQRLLVNLRGSSVASSSQFETMLIDIPKARYETYPVAVGGDGRISVGFSGRGAWDTTSNYSIKYTITNTTASY